MLYDAYEMQRSLLAGASTLANIGAGWLNNPANPLRLFADGADRRLGARRLRPCLGAARQAGIRPRQRSSSTAGRSPVTEEIVLRKPFGQLKHFRKEGVDGGPKLLIVAPMSGHYATLLRGTVERMLPGHDVYITDWRDAKLVPLDDGRFDLDDYIDYLIAFLEHIGPGAHMLAVCQPSVPAYAAAALMSADKHPCRPKTLTMMGGPIDTRKAPTEVNTVATQRPFAWFEQQCDRDRALSSIRARGRPVYPGFLQLAGFMAMNLGDHLTSHWEMFKHLVQGDGESAEASKDFYDEYRAVCDMTAEFYLQTVDVVFQRHLLPKGELMHRGRRVDPAAIARRRPARHRGRARRHLRRRPDQGRARHLDRPAGEA